MLAYAFPHCTYSDHNAVKVLWRQLADAVVDYCGANLLFAAGTSVIVAARKREETPQTHPLRSLRIHVQRADGTEAMHALVVALRCAFYVGARHPHLLAPLSRAQGLGGEQDKPRSSDPCNTPSVPEDGDASTASPLLRDVKALLELTTLFGCGFVVQDKLTYRGWIASVEFVSPSESNLLLTHRHAETSMDEQHPPL